MKVSLDTSKLHPQSKTRGIGIYAQHLVRWLPQVDTDIVFSSDSPDLIHFPTFDLFFLNLPLIKKSKWIITIHDITPLIFPRHFDPGIKGQVKYLFQRLNLTRADAIITDSHSSRKDIIKYLHVPPAKINVVYLGVDSVFHPLKIAKKPFILYVGDVNYNKNLPALLEAFALLKSDIDLYMVSNAWSKHIPEVAALNVQIHQLGISSRVKKITKLRTDSITQLVHWYNQAKVYVQPSLYEGFGLPVIEAMACGTPVVATNVASLPEICGHAAILVKPTVSDLAAGLRQALDLSSKQHQSYIRAGIAQAAKFTWEKTAHETIKVYNKVLRS